MNDFVKKLMLVCMLSLTGCLGGGPRSVPDPVSARIFVRAVDEETRRPMEGVKVYYTFSYGQWGRPLRLWQNEKTKIRFAVTNASGNAVIDLAHTVRVEVREAEFPGYLWIRSGSEYDETTNTWGGGAEKIRFTTTDIRCRLNPIGLTEDDPLLCLMRKGAKGKYWRDDWKRFEWDDPPDS